LWWRQRGCFALPAGREPGISLLPRSVGGLEQMHRNRHALPLLLLCLIAPSVGAAVQEGEVTVADGAEAAVRYKKIFDTPPRLTIVEFRQSWFKEKPFSKSDFVFVKQDATGFRVLNAHPEQGQGSVATIKWRAEGTLAAIQPTPPPPLSLSTARGQLTQEQVAEAIKNMGGKVTLDSAAPGGGLSRPVIGVDLHHARVADVDMGALLALTKLRTLNLSGTSVGDAGMRTIGSLTTLQTLHLNETHVSDVGLMELRRLGELRELSLFHTRVSDEGLASLQGMSNLRDLTLSGPHITDRGLVHLVSLRNLRHLYLSGTGVSKAGLEELKRSLPKTQIIQ
jgi:hypothetical protein